MPMCRTCPTKKHCGLVGAFCRCIKGTAVYEKDVTLSFALTKNFACRHACDDGHSSRAYLLTYRLCRFYVQVERVDLVAREKRPVGLNFSSQLRFPRMPHPTPICQLAAPSHAKEIILPPCAVARRRDYRVGICETLLSMVMGSLRDPARGCGLHRPCTL